MIDQHLDATDIAAYVEHAAHGERRARIESHLARCAECREEVSAALRVIDSHSGKRVWWWSVSAAAAAALVFLVARPTTTTRELPMRQRSEVQTGVVEHRGEPAQEATAPRLISPVGTVDSVESFAWSMVPGAARYRVRVFEADGKLLWEQETADTNLAAPAAARLQKGRSYYWRVMAETGFDRRVTSDLIEFVPRHERRP